MKVAVKFSVAFLLIITSISCEKEVVTRTYKAKNVIIIVIDGARYSETWGDSTHQNIPRIAGQLSKYGVVNTQFYNDGPTYTLAGHISITTGFYQEINNSGQELPNHPSFFQYFNAEYIDSVETSWIISSKDKLEVLANCQSTDFADKFKPFTNCGISGLSSGYREDSITFKVAMQVLSEHHPNIAFISFKEPDHSAHAGIWDNYLLGIKSTDEYAYQLWDYIQSDSVYKGNTALFITNDHGRHLDSIPGGFTAHGDNCFGCRHIMFYAFGPDFKQGEILDKHRGLIDITATISEILHIDMPDNRDEVMVELFR